MNLFVNCWEVEVGGEGGGAGGEEVEYGYSEGGGDGESGGAEEVNDEGADGGGLGDLVEGVADVGGVAADEFECYGGGADGGGGGGGGERREAVEGDGRGGLGDGIEVGVGGRGVEEAGGDEDVDGEFGGVVVEDELAKLYHGDYMAHSWSWV